MRVKRITGLTAVWLGLMLSIHGASSTDVSLSFEFLRSVIAGLVILFSGLWMVAKGEELPEDTGERLVPQRWIWYAMSIFFTIGAVAYTIQLLDNLLL